MKPEKFSIVGAAFTAILTGGGANGAADPSLADTLAAAFEYVAVPENRADPRSRQIEAAYLRLEGAAGGIPTFVFFGGPGESATDYGSLERLERSFAHLLARGDVVFVEQRGVGVSRPSLDCETIRFPMGEPVTVASVTAAHAAILPDCVAAAGADMRGYTSAAIADDAETIRESLGYDRINLSGGSYGAQQAYYYIRRHGDHVNRAALGQFLLPGTSLALPDTIDDYILQIGERVGPAYGQAQGGGETLAALIGSVFAALDEAPATVQLGDQSLTIGRTDLEITTSLALRRTREAWMLPMLFAQMQQGEFDFVGQAVWQFYRSALPVNAAVIAFDCADQTNALRRARFGAQAQDSLSGAGAHLPFPDVCEFVDHGSVSGEARAEGDLHNVPILIIQGELDARARDENLGALVDRDHVRMLVIGNATHDLGRSVSAGIGAELDTIEANFLATGAWPDRERIDVPLSLQ